AHKEHRQVVNARPIERLEQRPAIERAITEKSNYDAVLTAQLDRLRSAHCNGDAVGNHAISAEDAEREVRYVHRSAFTAAYTTRFSVQLLHHRNRVGSLRDAVAVAAV